MKNICYLLLMFTLCVFSATNSFAAKDKKASKSGKNRVELAYGSINVRYANGDRKDPDRCWNVRKDRMAKFILDQQLSIVGCQEVLHEQLVDLLERLPQYAYEGVGREDGKEKGEYAPIFWRKDEWTRVKGGTFWLSETPDVVASVGWDAALTRIATYVLLKHNKSGKLLMCINTHFDHVGYEARQQSAHLILIKAKEIAGNTPFVLTGDFNIDMSDAAYHVITHDAAFPILDTYMQGAPHEGRYYTFHDFSRIQPSRCTKIDYIFASPNIKVLKTYIQPEERGENIKHFSDHNPVVSRILLP